MYTKGECSCKADNTTGEITYCPLHESAPDLYEALKEIVDIVEDLLDSQSLKVYDSLTLQPARQALAKAEVK